MAHTASGRYIDTIPVTLASAVTLTATAAGTTVIELGDRNHLRLDLVVSAASGTLPTLDVVVQSSPNNSTWTTVAAFTQATAAGSEHKLFGPIDRYVRISSTLTGTLPSFTFTVSGDAV